MKKIWKEIAFANSLIIDVLSSVYTWSEKLSLLRVLLWSLLMIKLKSGTEEISQHFLGLRVSSYGYFNLVYLIREVFLKGEYEFDTKTNSPFIIDCGANIGMSILFFKKYYPNSRIIGFEPNPDVFQLLKKNVEQNKLQNVTLNNFCLSGSEGEVEFFLDENKGTLKGSIISKRGGRRCVKVPSKRLSDFFEEEVDLVKMDIEGAEKEVIHELVRNKRIGIPKTYLIEYHHNIPGQDSEMGDFLSQFEDQGYQCSIKAGFNHHGEFQDVFLSCSKREKSIR